MMKFKKNRKSIFVLSLIIALVFTSLGTVYAFAQNNEAFQVQTPQSIGSMEDAKTMAETNSSTEVFDTLFGSRENAISSDVHFCDDESCHADFFNTTPSIANVDIERIIEDIESGRIQLATVESLLDRYPNGTPTKMTFTDSNGITTEISLLSARDSSTVLNACAHSWQVGTYTLHTRNSDGSCYVDVWNAVRCSRCGIIGILDLVSVTFHRVCPH